MFKEKKPQQNPTCFQMQFLCPLISAWLVINFMPAIKSQAQNVPPLSRGQKCCCPKLHLEKK